MVVIYLVSFFGAGGETNTNSVALSITVHKNLAYSYILKCELIPTVVV
jgi:hypothetical protein